MDQDRFIFDDELMNMQGYRTEVMSKYVKELMMDQLRSDLDGSRSLLILDLKTWTPSPSTGSAATCARSRSGCGC